MPPLRKAGVRAPFLPGPLQATTDPLRRAVVIGALVPALLFGGNTQLTGRRALPENVSWLARRAIVQVPPVPVPGASAWRPVLVRAVVVAPVDRPAPLQLIVQTPPVPGALALVVGVVRDGDRLPFGAIVQPTPPVPVSGAAALSVGRVLTVPTDPLRPVVAIVAQPPIPGSAGGLLAPPAKPTYIAVAVPAERIAAVPAEMRGVRVGAETRVIGVAAEDRDVAV